MSQEHVETVRRGLEAFNRGDLDEALATFDPNVEMKTLLSGWVHGREELRAVIEQLEAVMGPVRFRLDQLVDAGETIVGVVGALDARGRLSGISGGDFTSGPEVAFAWTFGDGLIVRGELFASKTEALEAVGLDAHAMSEHNVDIVRRGFEAWDRRDFEAAAADFSPDLVIDASERVLNPAVYTGIEGAMRFRSEIAETWNEFHVEIEDTLAAGDEVVVLVRSTGKGRASGAQVDARAAWVVTVIDRKVTRVRLYRDRSQALEAVDRADQA